MHDFLSKIHLKSVRAYVASVFFLICIIGIALGEWLGWPFLATPIANQLTKKLDRVVSFSAIDQSTLESNNKKASIPFQIRFIGGIRLEVAQLNIAPPSWSKAPHSLSGKQIALHVRYIDLWQAYRAKYLHIKALRAETLDLHLERLANGNATWKLSSSNPESYSLNIPSFGSLEVAKGVLKYTDAILDAAIKAQFSFIGASNTQKTNAAFASKQSILKVDALGYFQKQPLRITLLSSGIVPKALDQSSKVPVNLTINASLGKTVLAFKGSTKNALQSEHISGAFNLKGQSLATLGDLLGITLPTTSRFSSQGNIKKQQGTWQVALNKLDVGASHLSGNFVYEASRKTPLLTGQLNGTQFFIADLAPAFGSSGSENNQRKVLPSKAFDLAALRAMNADIRINLKSVDLNTNRLQPLSPLLGHLTLVNGVLKVKELDARTAKGALKGDLTLDGRGKNALWQANLRWNSIRLEDWVRQTRDKGSIAYISGKLNGKANLHGQGISSAQMLATMKGSIQSELQNGAISHLLIEAAGLDLAQSLGVMFKGDDALPLQCAVADLVADNGILRPKVLVLDTTDSAVWLTGNVSLAQETIDLKMLVMPKDFSPISLRSPLRVHGTFANPKTSLEKANIGLKLAGSVLLSMINPLAAIIPLLDSGDVKEAKLHAANCKALMQYTTTKPKK